MTRCRFTFVVALSFLGWGQRLCLAQSTPPASSDRAATAPVIGHPRTQDPGELETALLATEPAQAVALLSRFTCASYSNIEAAAVVRRAWDRRDAVDAARGLKDTLIRTLMAKCLAEYKPRFSPLQPEDAPVLAQLRLALASSDSEQVRAAATGLTQTATAEDVQTMVSAAARVPSQRTPIVAALSQVCRVDAIDAAKTIEEVVTDDRQRAEIDSIQARSSKTRRLFCGFDANIVPNSVSQADIADFFDPGHSDPVRSIDEFKDILNSTNVHDARQALSQLRCVGGEKEKSLVSDAWAARDSGEPIRVAHNFSVRVLMAKCFVDITSRASQDKIPVAVRDLLREAVKGSDPIDFIVGVEGLTRIATAADIGLIAEAAEGRSSVLAEMVVQTLSRSCAPGAQEAVAVIRGRTTKPQAARDMDYAIGVTKRARDYACGMH